MARVRDESRASRGQSPNKRGRGDEGEWPVYKASDYNREGVFQQQQRRGFSGNNNKSFQASYIIRYCNKNTIN